MRAGGVSALGRGHRRSRHADDSGSDVGLLFRIKRYRFLELGIEAGTAALKERRGKQAGENDVQLMGKFPQLLDGIRIAFPEHAGTGGSATVGALRDSSGMNHYGNNSTCTIPGSHGIRTRQKALQISAQLERRSFIKMRAFSGQ